MHKTIQKRTLKTRAKVPRAAAKVVRKNGYQALPVDEVVRAAGVAKGAFFAHFHDKDALMEILIGDELNACLDQAQVAGTPRTVPQIIDALGSVHDFMMSERYVFDLLIRYSGAIAFCFVRYFRIVMMRLEQAVVRQDVPSELLAEGVQAFAIQAMSLKFCAAQSATSFTDRLETYLRARLTPAA